MTGPAVIKVWRQHWKIPHHHHHHQPSKQTSRLWLSVAALHGLQHSAQLSRKRSCMVFAVSCSAIFIQLVASEWRGGCGIKDYICFMFIIKQQLVHHTDTEWTLTVIHFDSESALLPSEFTHKTIPSWCFCVWRWQMWYEKIKLQVGLNPASYSQDVIIVLSKWLNLFFATKYCQRYAQSKEGEHLYSVTQLWHIMHPVKTVKKLVTVCLPAPGLCYYLPQILNLHRGNFFWGWI